MKKILEHQPHVQLKSGQMFLCATFDGGHNGVFAGVSFVNGVANDGAPISAEQVMKLRGRGVRIVWWPWEHNAKIVWPDNGDGPHAYVQDVADEKVADVDPEKDTLDLHPKKKRRGRPRKDKEV